MSTISGSMSSVSSYGYGSMPSRMEGRGKPDFSKIDTDSSGGLDQTELKAMLEKGPKGVNGMSSDDLFSKLDSDGDGSVTESELKSGMKPPSNDEQVQQSGWGSMGMDTQSFASMMGGQMGQMGQMNGPPPPPPPSDDQGMSITDAINSLDSDDDGSITSAEFGITESDESDSAQKALFDAIDTDKDGSISKSETSSFDSKIKALLEKMQQIGMQNAEDQSSRSSLSVVA